VHLSLTHCDLDVYDRFSLPNLKSLVILGQHVNHTQAQSKFVKRTLSTLSSLIIDLVHMPSLPPSVFTSSSLSILFRTYPAEITNPSLQQIRNLYLNFAHYDQEGIVGIDNWTKLVRDSTHELEAVYLVGRRVREGAEAAAHLELRAAISEFVTACTSRNVEIHWEERKEDCTFDEIVPPSFLRKSKARQIGNRGV
jgi:hypothetical protein